MSDLEKQLERKVSEIGTGTGYGDPDALAQHDREIEYLKFQITQLNQYKTALMSAIIGGLVGSLVTLLSSAF